MADKVIHQVRVSSTGDVDEAGRHLVVLADVVELRERDGRVTAQVAVADIDHVDVRRRLSTTTVVIVGADGELLKVRGVRPADAQGLREVIGALLVADQPSGSVPTVDALRRLEELAAKGLLTDKEVAEQRSALVRQRTGGQGSSGHGSAGPASSGQRAAGERADGQGPSRGRSTRRAGTRPLFLVVTVLALVAAACGSDDGTASSDAGASGGNGDGSPWAVDAPVLGAGDAAFTVASLEGTPTVLWFWAPWCVSCRAEAPEILAAADRFADEATIVGVAGRGEVPAMEGFVADTGTGSLTHVVDADGSVWSDFGVFAQPAFAFISADGDVDVFVGTLGSRGLDERLTALVAA